MNKFLKARSFFLLSLLICCNSLFSNETKPNIIIFFTDDTGYRDIGPFGGLTPTPSLNKLAKGGMKLTSFYVASVACTPSRAALLTGCYADRIGMGRGVVFPGDARGLNPTEITIPEMLKEVGYTTGCFGKWHLGDQPEFMPLSQGFDEYEGIPYSNDMWDYIPEKLKREIESGKKTLKKEKTPLPWMIGNKVVAWIDNPLSQALMNDAIADATVNFIERHKEQPFFIYVPFPSTHNPKCVLKDRGEKIAALGCDPNHVSKYAQIAEIDTCVGKVLNTLKKHNLDQNTLIIYSNDNGGSSKFYKEGLKVPRGGKFGPKYEGNMKMSTLAWWPNKIPAGSVCDEISVSIDLLPTIANITGAHIPNDRIIDGKDILHLLTGRGTSPHDYMFYELGAIRQGDWKLVEVQTKVNENGKTKRVRHTELYNLKIDYEESKNLANEQPELVTQLQAVLKKHIEKLNSEIRPAGQSENPSVILKNTENIPSLAKYLNRESEIVY